VDHRRLVAGLQEPSPGSRGNTTSFQLISMDYKHSALSNCDDYIPERDKTGQPGDAPPPVKKIICPNWRGGR
jgi:hypothetical protein